MPIERRLPRLKNIAEEENEDEDDDENSVFFFFLFYHTKLGNKYKKY